jgi:CHAT domain-containing protein
MPGKVFFILFSFLLFSSFKTGSPGPQSLGSVILAYNKADKLFNAPNTSSKTDSFCLDEFRKVIASLETFPRTRTTDSLLYQSNYKSGVLFETYKDYLKATASYLQAIRLSSTPEERFMNYILAGAGYYNLNNFDSATFYLLKAAQSPDSLGKKEDRVRMYNTLGVLYYDNGNYLQSKNYFRQALLLIGKKDLTDEYSLQLNIAACFFKLGLYEQALSVYNKILNYHELNTPLYMNLGRTYRSLRRYKEALSYFNKVSVSAAPNVLNEMARTALEQGNAKDASDFLNRYKRQKLSLHTNPLDDGENEIYWGDLDIFNNNPESALHHFQNALSVYSGNYSDPDIRKNPVGFTGSFAFYRLFEVLYKKATAWEMIYEKTSKPEDLISAYETYQSTISLLSHIEKSYEMDDAKILLKQKSSSVFTRAIETCLQLNKLYPRNGYLEAAFLIAEKNKASVMSAQFRQKNLLSSTGPENDFEAEERNIKFNIARLISQGDEHLDARALQKINDAKSVYETRLVNLHRKMEANNRFYQLKYSDDFPSVAKMKLAMGRDQALISIYNTSSRIEIFVLTSTWLKHISLDSGDLIRKDVQNWIQNLQTDENGHHAAIAALKKILSSRFVQPISALAGEKKEWVIVPDGLFFQLPIESLPEDESGKMVIENHEISYEFSARFMVEQKENPLPTQQNTEVLSFAPFSAKGAILNTGGITGLEKLPYSKEEISELPGRRFADQSATKGMFLKNIKHFQIVHLATHAITDLDNPSSSYIAFYPSSGVRSEDFLFLDEVYSLNMDSCRLIVISACETGRGELVHNEGVMSFARAFLYAGCPSTINTLWKADDRSTAEIVRIFYKHLEYGETKSRALQQAKLEFIRNNPLYRNPSFWSHIILTGDPCALYKKKQPWIWAALLISLSTISWIVIRNKK